MWKQLNMNVGNSIRKMILRFKGGQGKREMLQIKKDLRDISTKCTVQTCVNTDSNKPMQKLTLRKDGEELNMILYT